MRGFFENRTRERHGRPDRPGGSRIDYDGGNVVAALSIKSQSKTRPNKGGFFSRDMHTVTTAQEVRKIVATEMYEMILRNSYSPNWESVLGLAMKSDRTIERMLEAGIGAEHKPWVYDDIVEYGL